MSKFKVGDKVRIKVSENMENVNSEMLAMNGKVVTIADDSGYSYWQYRIMEDNREWLWDDRTFEPVQFVNTGDFEKIEELVPGKVVRITFTDGDVQKAICNEADVFSLETAIAVCYAKHLCGGTKEYNKAIRAGMNKWNQQKKEAEEKIIREKIAEKKARKKEAYKKRREEKRRENDIEMRKEAYLRAMREMDKIKTAASCE